MMQLLIRIQLFFLFILTTSASFAQEKLVISNSNQLHIYERNVLYLIDSSNNLSLKQIVNLNDSEFKLEPHSKMTFGNSHYAWWFKINIENKTAQELYVLLRNHEIKELDYYSISKDGIIDSVKSGFTRPFENRLFNTNTPVFKAGVNPKTILLRIKTQVMYLPIKVGTIQPIIEEIHFVDVFNMFIVGIMLALTLYNLVIYFFVKDKLHLYYFAYILSSVFLILVVRGYVNEFFPHIPTAFTNHGNLLGTLVAFFSYLFAITYLNTKKRAPFFHKLLTIMIVVDIVMLVTEFLPYRAWHNDFFQLLHFTMMPVMVAAGIAVYMKGYKPAIYYIVAFGVMNAGVMISLSGYLGWLSNNNFIVHNAYYLGATLESIILSFAIAYRFNIYKKEAFEKEIQFMKERNRIMADLHDDVGASLSSMHIYGDLAKAVWDKQPEESWKMIDKISTTSKDLMGRMGDIIWSMKPVNEDKYTLEARLKNYTSELLSSKNISCEFAIDETLAASFTIPETRKNLLLIAKEAINNIAKYSNATQASIRLEKSAGMSMLVISDNGKGFSTVANQQGNGIGNMKQRCEQLNGEFKIESTLGKGVVITCLIPIATISHLG